MMQQIRREYYFPSITIYLRNWAQHRETWNKIKQIKNTKLKPELLKIREWEMGPEDTMQIDLIPELPPSGSYENIVRAKDVFSRCAFAHPVLTPTAVNTAKVIIGNMTMLAYLPTILIRQKRSLFVSQVTSDVAAVVGKTFEHATSKNAQPIGVLERTHATRITSLKMASGEFRN